MGKILKITEKTPKEITLPDGNYLGTWSSNIITVVYDRTTYELETEEGVRGIGFKVVVNINGNDKTFVDIAN